ncbi:MBL fold metallo-hydrolase [bacterium]|nr:MBL fold metallo-hydrolase [bacterium]
MRYLRRCIAGSMLLALTAGGVSAQSSLPLVRVHYLGHSAFVLRFDNGITVVTDYGHENIWKEWGWDSPILSIGDLQPDVMTFSHKHDDHYDPDRIPSSARYILSGSDSLEIDGLRIVPVLTDEDDPAGESNTSFLFFYKGVSICHLGDAQAYIMNVDTPSVQRALTGKFPHAFDLLIMPVEGKKQFIPEAVSFLKLLHPRVMIPAHFWSQAYLERFLQQAGRAECRIVREGRSVFDLVPAAADDTVRVTVLERASYPGESAP